MQKSMPSSVKFFLSLGVFLCIFLWATYPNIEHVCGPRILRTVSTAVYEASLPKSPSVNDASILKSTVEYEELLPKSTAMYKASLPKSIAVYKESLSDSTDVKEATVPKSAAEYEASLPMSTAIYKAYLPKDLQTATCASGTDFITQRLIEAELNWSRANKIRSEPLENARLKNGINKINAQILWDFFYPSFDCPFTKERIGRVGDGGKWICGFGQLEVKPSKCVVLSFGVNHDTSFEEEILQRAPNCTVHMFDPTVVVVPSVVERYPGRAFFRPIGIGAEISGNYSSLKSILNEIGTETVDVLKLDIEGSEWDITRNILEDFPEKLPFAQLQIEVHLGRYGEARWQKVLSDWFNSLESAGLRQFFQEPNLLPSGHIAYRELAFLNTKMPPFELPQLSDSGYGDGLE